MNKESKEGIYRALTMRILFRYPFNPSNVGFRMLVEAIVLTLESDEMFVNILNIYEKIARERKIKVGSVDKAIKTAIENVTSVIKLDKANFHNAPMQQAFIKENPRSLIFATSETVKVEMDNLKITRTD